MSTLREVFLEELGSAYDAEKQILGGLQKLADAADSEELRASLEMHLDETESQVSRLEQVFEAIGAPVKPGKCRALQGLLSDAEHMIERQSDAALIAAVQKIEHYEIATYGSLCSWANLLGEDDAADLLEETLDEEKSMDEKLTEIAESSVNEGEGSADAEEDDEEGFEESEEEEDKEA